MTDLSTWTPRERPARSTITGDRVRLEPLDVAAHAPDLWLAANAGDDQLWDYLPYGPFADEGAFRTWLASIETSEDPLFFAIVDAGTGQALGMCSFLRIDPGNGVIEIGHIWFSAALQRSTLATEAIFLLQQTAMEDLGYRRLEWKCNNANARSKRAAERFGFTFEGIFRQHSIVKGANRDTAWFSLLDGEWPAYARAVRTWLAPDNFTADGVQIRSLRDLRTEA